MATQRMTRERADRSYRRFKYFVHGYRVLLVLFTVGLLVSIPLGEWRWIYAAYIGLNMLWWVVSILWLKQNDSTRDMNYRTADKWDEIERLYGKWN